MLLVVRGRGPIGALSPFELLVMLAEGLQKLRRSETIVTDRQLTCHVASLSGLSVMLHTNGPVIRSLLPPLLLERRIV